MGIYIIIGIVLLLVIIFISMYNKLVHAKQVTEEAFSGMDVYLKKRYDLIPNLVESVKGYMAHEKSTLESVIAARNAAIAPGATAAEKISGNKALDGAIGRLFALSEQYPDLKANTQFIDLQRQIQQSENDIAESRKYYNGAVRRYNTLVKSVPSNIVAGIGRFHEEPYYEVTNAQERENVKVSF